MSTLQFGHMTIAKDNIVSPANVTSVAITNFTTVSGFPASNLEYPDAWTVMKAATVSGDPTINHQFTSSWQPQVLGILNHNLFEVGYQTIVAERFNGSGWDLMGSIAITGDSDIWLAWSLPSAAASWRFRITDGTNGLFRIGSVFYGSVITLQGEPFLYNQVRTTPLTVETATGGAKYISFGADVRTASVEITWSRTTMTNVDTIRRLRKYELIGILSSEQCDATTTITGQEIFWGYVGRRTMTPRGPGGINTLQPARYDMTLELEGAV